MLAQVLSLFMLSDAKLLLTFPVEKEKGSPHKAYGQKQEKEVDRIFKLMLLITSHVRFKTLSSLFNMSICLTFVTKI